MKFERGERFVADYARLTDRERRLFRRAVREFNDAYEHRGHNALPIWPAALRIKAVQGAPGVWEMTWSFSGPDGRATFAFVTVDGEPAIRWRRIGDHRIFQQP